MQANKQTDGQFNLIPCNFKFCRPLKTSPSLSDFGLLNGKVLSDKVKVFRGRNSEAIMYIAIMTSKQNSKFFARLSSSSTHDVLLSTLPRLNIVPLLHKIMFIITSLTLGKL